jgi:type VI secretion system protein VasI
MYCLNVLGSRGRCAAYLVLLYLTGCVTAVQHDELAQCAAETAPGARLACYDSLANELEVDVLDESAPGASQWRSRTEISPIDDSTNVHLSVPANQEFVKASGETIVPVLYLRCKENTTALIIAYGTYLGERTAQVSYRIDSRLAHNESWQLSSTRNMVGLWKGSAAIPVIKRLLGAEQLLVQVTPLGENRVTSTFPVAGLEEAIKPLRAACHW